MLAQVRGVFGVGKLSQVGIIFVRRLAEATLSLKSRGEIEVNFRPVLLLLRYGKAKLGLGCLVIAARHQRNAEIVTRFCVVTFCLLDGSSIFGYRFFDALLAVE